MLFLAGHETSAAALGWALYLIANRPDVQARMREEADAALGDRRPEFADMRRMPFIRDVFHETLRLYPPVAFLARDAAGPSELCGQPIEAHAQTIVPTWLMHRHGDLLGRRRSVQSRPVRRPGDQDRARLRLSAVQHGAARLFGHGLRAAGGDAGAGGTGAPLHFHPTPGHVPEPVSRLTVRSANGLPLRVERRAGL